MAFWRTLEEYFQNDFQRWTILLTVEIATADFHWWHFCNVPRDAFPTVPVQFLHRTIESFAILVPNTQTE